MANTSTPVLLLTGYLGSGKTTLVNHILSNERGIKFAVIVNDIGEVNIDADLIQKGGIVDTKDDSLVALQNGCICCTLKMDLVKQIEDILKMDKFDYIVIEASGICEPVPIAQTICTMQQMSRQKGQESCHLDCVATVVDALRMASEFGCGSDLMKKNIDDEDIENLVIQQIEFCNIIVLNKVSEVKKEELERIKQIIRALQPSALIIESDYANVDLTKLINTHRFDFNKAAMSAAWIREFDRPVTDEEEEEAHDGPHHHDHDDDDDDDEHEHHHEHHHHDDDDDDDDEHEHHHEHEHEHGHHHHHHHHEGGEVEEYGIGTFVYYRRDAFDLNKFDAYVAKKWSRNIIRAKGICYFTSNPDMSYIFEQAGVQKKVTECGLWLCTAPKDELEQMITNDPTILRDWDDEYGDKMQKIVFIGQNLDKEQITKDLDFCLVKKK